MRSEQSDSVRSKKCNQLRKSEVDFLCSAKMSTLGRRALASQQALDKASANVIKSLT